MVGGLEEGRRVEEMVGGIIKGQEELEDKEGLGEKKRDQEKVGGIRRWWEKLEEGRRNQEKERGIRSRYEEI